MPSKKVPALSASVGAKPRSSKGPEPKNSKKDVMIVQKLLTQCGFKVNVNGRVNDRMIKVIKLFQKQQVGIKDPDGVVDVNKRTYQKLVSLSAVAAKKGQGAGDEETSREKYRKFEYRGEVFTLTEKDYVKAMAQVSKRLLQVVDALQSQYDVLNQIQREMLDTIQGTDGLMQSIVFFTSAKWAGLDVPNFKKQGAAGSAIVKARSAAKKMSPNARKLLDAAMKAVQAYDREVAAYRNKLIGGATSITEGLQVTADVSFGVAEVIGTAVLVTRGVSPKAAQTSSSTFFAMIKSSATEVGEHVADPKKEWGDSARKVLADTLTATATSLIAGGIKADKLKGMAARVASSLASKPPFKQIGVAASKKFIEKTISEGGQKILVDGMSEIVKALGDMVKKERMLTRKEVEKRLDDYLVSVLTGKLLKKLEFSTWKYTRGLQSTLESKEAKKLGDWFAKLPRTKRAKILTAIFKKQQEEIIKLGIGKVMDQVKTTDNQGAIVKKATGEALKNTTLMALIAKEAKKYNKK